jgi:glutamate synthase (NADPH/NADH) small chain
MSAEFLPGDLAQAGGDPPRAKPTKGQQDVESRPFDRRRRLRAEPVHPAKRTPQDRLKDFQEVSVPLTFNQAVEEANRCLQCEHQPCTIGCPANNEIRDAMWLLSLGDVRGAALKFMETSNLPDICGRLCPQEKQCEGACVLQGCDAPIAIGKLETFCTDTLRDVMGGFPTPKLAPPLGTRVAVVGSGPAGLAVAEELVKLGHGVTVFEAWPFPGGLLSYGIPGFKLNKEIIEKHIKFLENIGVEFRCNTRIGKDLTVDDLLKKHGFDAVFLGHGASAGTRMKTPGEDLKNVYSATEYLVRANLPDEMLPEAMRGKPHAGLKTVVVGGGDTAMDCVRTARRLSRDGEAWCVYRRSEAEMPGRIAERKNAREEGVKFEWLTLPVRFLGDSEGKVIGCECIRMKLVKPDAKGRRTPEPIEGSNFVLECDTAVIAIGYGVDQEIAESTENLKTTKWGTIWVNSENDGESSRQDEVWAAGDCAHGADLIVTAMVPARKAARSIDTSLRAHLHS